MACITIRAKLVAVAASAATRADDTGTALAGIAGAAEYRAVFAQKSAVPAELHVFRPAARTIAEDVPVAATFAFTAIGTEPADAVVAEITGQTDVGAVAAIIAAVAADVGAIFTDAAANVAADLSAIVAKIAEDGADVGTVAADVAAVA